MSLSHKEISLFVEEFKKLLSLRIEKLYIPEENIIILTLYKSGFKKMLLIEVGNDYSGIYFIDERPKQKLIASTQNKFRNLLTSTIITDIKQINNDRVIELSVKNKNENRKIIIELTGRYGNIFVLNEDNNIDAVLLNKKDDRELSLYNKYIEPKVQNNNKELNIDFDKEKYFNFFEWLEIYAKKVKENKEKQLENSFVSQINKKIKKLKRKKEKLTKDLKKLESYKNNKKIGELLKANLYLFKRGNESISVVDYYDTNMPTIEIKLDKSKNAIENMEIYFKKYDKFKRGVKFIDIEFKKIEKEIILLEKRKESEKKEFILKDKKSIKKKRIEQKHIQYKIYKSSNNKYKILVGKGSVDNDYLTFKIASGNDIWLHVNSYSGSHVIIKKNNKKDKIDINTIMEAAHLAILNSKAPNDDNVEVSYTFKKFVKKPPKSKPGAVIYSQEKRIYLKLDMKIIEKLK